MKIKTSEIIAGLTTTIIFVAIFSVVFKIPNDLPDLSDLKEWVTNLIPEKEEPKKTKKTTVTSADGKVGKVIDNFNGVNIYYNGRVRNVKGRNVTSDGYNLGLKYQCVEFVKRYYYEYYNHKMPNSYGNAKDFFDYTISDGNYNGGRGLNQYTNPSTSKPKVGDLLIFGATQWNQFGHVAIISKVSGSKIQIAQQNPGSNNPSRQWFDYTNTSSGYHIQNQYVLGWLRKG